MALLIKEIQEVIILKQRFNLIFHPLVKYKKNELTMIYINAIMKYINN